MTELMNSTTKMEKWENVVTIGGLKNGYLSIREVSEMYKWGHLTIFVLKTRFDLGLV